MSHIKLPEGLQGIRGPMAFRPETAKQLNELAEVLLHAPKLASSGGQGTDCHIRLVFERTR
jgi:hypothetical protein